MSSAVSNNSMRQQLDELDVLLQRMLSLPINQMDEQNPPINPPSSASAPKPPLATSSEGFKPSALSILNEPMPIPPALTPERNLSINLNPKFGSSILGESSPAPATVPVTPWQPSLVVPDSSAAPSATPATVRIEPIPPRPFAEPVLIPEPAANYTPTHKAPTGLWVLPFVILNKMFDILLGIFGPLGAFFRGSTGRNLLGAAGLVMLISAIARVVGELAGWSW